ncbi:hypothetical protein RYX36_034023 [Vicia faba]
MDLPETLHDFLLVFLGSGLILGTNSHFVAASQLLIYVGAINILIIFAVMFMNSSEYYQDFHLWTIGDGITLIVCTNTSWYGIIWTTRPNQIIEQDLITIAATEEAIGLAIVSSIARNRKSTRINSISDTGLDGAILQVISHGFIGAALFFLAGTSYDRLRLLYLDEMGGMAIPMPKIFTIFTILSMASLALPGMSGPRELFISISILIPIIGIGIYPDFIFSFLVDKVEAILSNF